MRLLFYCCTFIFSINAFTQTKNFIDQPYLETTAKVDTLIQPDEIYMNIIIQEKDTKGKVAVEIQEKKMVEALKSIGIDTKKQLTLSDFGSNFKKYFLRKKDILKSKSYELKVFDTKTAGKTMLKLEQIGIANVRLSKTEYSKIEELKLSLKSKAISKAKKQADFLLAPLKQKIISAIYISDKFNTNYRRYNRGNMEMAVADFSTKNTNEYTPPTIEFKPIKIESEVSVTFAIE